MPDSHWLLINDVQDIVVLDQTQAYKGIIVIF